ncbi:MAG: deoxyribose-phosphate aldolase [Coprobacillaceae bacterium]
MMNITKQQLAKMIDQTLLKPYATNDDFKTFLQSSKEYNFKMVAINSAPVKMCKEYLKDTDIHVGAAISFPLGQTTLETKLFETRDAILNGADEIDYVINITELKNGNIDYIEKEMKEIVTICKEANVISKVIFENCYLTEDEKKQLCHIALKIKPDFIKTSTGFGTSGATLEDVRLMKSIVKDEVQIKAAGGIKDLATALAFIDAGATRLGTSAGITILDALEQ